MGVISIQQLLEAGVHFGHYTKRWDPRMKEYIYTARNGIYIIDLEKTAAKIEEAYAAMLEIAKTGKKVLFVGTKKQAQEAVKETAQATKQYYVDSRWLGGTLTNFKTIRKRIVFLEHLDKLVSSGEINKYPRKEIQDLMRQREKLEYYLNGIRKMEQLPGALFIIDPRKEENAIREAKRLNIPIFGIVDTNCNPEGIDYVIPANDDAIKSVKLIVSTVGNAIIEASGGKVEKVDDPGKVDINKIFEQAPVKVDMSLKEDVKTFAKAPEKQVKAKKDDKVVKEEKPAKETKTTKAEPKKEEKPVKETKAAATKEAKPAKETKTTKAEPKKVTKTTSFTKEELNKQTVAELRELAKKQKLKGYTSLKKAELIDLIISSK